MPLQHKTHSTPACSGVKLPTTVAIHIQCRMYYVYTYIQLCMEIVYMRMLNWIVSQLFIYCEKWKETADKRGQKPSLTKRKKSRTHSQHEINKYYKYSRVKIFVYPCALSCCMDAIGWILYIFCFHEFLSDDALTQIFARMMIFNKFFFTLF